MTGLRAGFARRDITQPIGTPSSLGLTIEVENIWDPLYASACVLEDGEGGRVAIVGIDSNDSAANAIKFAGGKGVSYPVGVDSALGAADAYNVAALPQTFFLDARHRVVERVFGALTRAELQQGVRLMDR